MRVILLNGEAWQLAIEGLGRCGAVLKKRILAYLSDKLKHTNDKQRRVGSDYGFPVHLSTAPFLSEPCCFFDKSEIVVVCCCGQAGVSRLGHFMGNHDEMQTAQKLVTTSCEVKELAAPSDVVCMLGH